MHILIVDDHAIVRDGLKQLLHRKFPDAVFGEGQNAQEALDRVSEGPWDVILLDITMPGRSGLDVLKQIKTIQPETKVLVLTMHPEDQYAMRVLRTGGSGYLTKETAFEEVAKAVTEVVGGGTYISASLAESLAANAPYRSPHEALSDREYQVMRKIAAGKSPKEIAYELSLSSKTVSTYRTRVLKKLKLKSNAEVIRYAVREKLAD